MTLLSELTADSALFVWKLGEASTASAVADSSANGRNGTYSGTGLTLARTGLVASAPSETAMLGAASGSSGSASIVYSSWMNQASISIFGVMKGTAATVGVYLARDAQSTTRVWQLQRNASGKLVFTVLSGAIPSATSVASVNDGSIHDFEVTYDGTTCKIYIDGALDNTVTLSQALGQPTVTGLTAGNSGRTISSGFAADMQYVCLMPQVNNSTRVTAHHAARVAVTGTAAPTVTLSVSAAGRLGLFGGATKAVTLGATASGVVVAGTSGSVSTSITLGAVAAGFIASTGGGTPVITIGAVAAGRLGLFGGATKALSVGVVAAGTVSADLTRGATKTVSVSAVAAGVVLTGPGALPVIHIGVVAAGVVQVPAETQLIFGTGGRNRDGTCDVEWEGEPDPPPWSVTESIRRISAHVIDSFTVTGPRHNDVKVTFRTESTDEPDYRIIVGGRDITNFRGMRTPQPSWQLISPGRYGPGSLTIPQIKAGIDTPGEGNLWWLSDDFPPIRHKVQHADGTWHTVYKGWLSDENESGGDYTVTLLGELTGIAGMQQRPPRINLPRVKDLGDLVVSCIRNLPRALLARAPAGGTGIPTVDSGGSMTQWDWLSQTMAASTTRGGKLWTFMPDSDGVYQLSRKNEETVHYTLYVDDAHVKADLRRDYTEEDNVIYGDAVRQDGMRINGMVVPGMASDSGRVAYPMASDAPMPPGTADADTVSGSGVTALQSRLVVIGLRDDGDGYTGVIDDETTRAVRRAQLIADLDEHGDTVLGTVDVRTWHAIYDGDMVGWSMGGAKILPLAQDTRTRRWRYNSSGQRIGRNHRYNPHVMPRERYVSMGQVQGAGQARDWAQQTLDDGSADYVGTIDLPMGALIAGDHSPGDPFDASMLVDARTVTPNQNVKLANHRAGLCHISGVALNGDSVQLTVDTRARDTEPIWAIQDRLRTAREHRGRVWRRNNLSSTQTRDVGAVWDVFGGIVDDYWHIPGHTWVIVPVRAGREGTIMRLRVHLRDARPEFCWAMFCRSITDDTLTHLIGNPLTDDGRRNWRRKSETLTEDHFMIYAAGTDTNPLGYHPTTKPNASADFPDKTVDEVRTGDHRDDGGFSYRAFGAPVIWNAFYADRDTVLQPGRLFRVQLSDQV